jgi:hypothetical protein
MQDEQQSLSVDVLNGTFWKAEAKLQQKWISKRDVLSPTGESVIQDLQGFEITEGNARFDIPNAVPGLYTLGLATRPRVARLSAEKFQTYLHEEGLADMSAAVTERGEHTIAASERYSKWAKAIVGVGAPVSDSLETVLGYKAELVALGESSELRVGGTFRARLLFDGKPKANALVYAGSERNAPEDRGVGLAQAIVLRTNGDGVVEFPLNAEGLWYVRHIAIERTGDSEYWYSNLLVLLGAADPRITYESHWATLVFEVP